MKFLFVSESPYLPQERGAVQVNTHELALALVKHGHSAVVASEFLTTDLLGVTTRLLGKVIPKRKLHDSFLGYPVYRRWNVMASLPELVDEIKPDIVVVQPRNHILLALELARMTVPTIVYFHDANQTIFHGRPGNPADVRQMTCLSISKDTAQKLHDEFGVDSTVIGPIAGLDRIEPFKAAIVDRLRSTLNVTVVDPQMPNGVYLPIKLASSFPEIPICFLPSQELPKDQERVLKDCARMYRNLKIQRPTKRMGEVFARAKFIVIQGSWDATKDRLAQQAHCSRVPIVTSNLGTIPDVLGPGDILLDPDDPFESWINTVRSLWHDESYYLEHASAVVIPNTGESQLKGLVQMAEKVIEQQGASRKSAAQ